MPPSKESPPSVSHLTESCISKFKHLINSGGSNEQESLETRLADFNLWADGVGATAKLGASLDTRFHARPDDLLLVKGTLTMLADFLDEYAILASDRSPTDEAIINVDSSIRNLAMIGVAIRRTGKASRSRRADRLFDRAEHQELRRHLECIVLLRPSETQPQLEDLDASKVNELIASNAPQLNELVVPMLERLVECRMSQLGASKLSVVQNRLIEANLRRRHRFLLAQRRSRHSRADQVRQVETDNPPDKESSPRTGPVSH
ncbi:hypothetical protein IMZ48_31920, partial [Candidatus Bathyarchaeota archaeon]|nr:hypothetical protein [Candidatus Bathyarchaeota archaeon]